ncbi:unnamed protein product [Lactuca virosa]|uniref:Phospholipase/carboxylesterase/thioesterase domain-containing protein n=1 Tax=Lactuca virosa TaxID=75947 RepID=A0AAU9NPZ6_9ASTR|nr:unnamed protein product [Lactuca virosa]
MNQSIIKTFFTSPHFANTRWSFPSAPPQPVTCNRGFVMPSSFDIQEMPITANSLRDESSLLKAVQNVHSVIDKEIATGVDPKNVFICGLSQGALTLGSVLLYPKTLDHTRCEKRTPILWFHGMADMTVLFEAGQAGPPFLQRAGINCEFKVYPDLGHSISDEELQHMESWIISRLQSSA